MTSRRLTSYPFDFQRVSYQKKASFLMSIHGNGVWDKGPRLLVFIRIVVGLTNHYLAVSVRDTVSTVSALPSFKLTT